MRIPNYVKPMPLLFKTMPRGFVLPGGLIFLRRDVYKDLLSDNPSPQNVGILIHEEAHRKRGINKFFTGMRYWFNPEFRFQEELAADKERFTYLKKHKVKFNFRKRARDLSGLFYLWCVSYKRAKKELEKMWEEE